MIDINIIIPFKIIYKNKEISIKSIQYIALNKDHNKVFKGKSLKKAMYQLYKKVVLDL